MQPLVISIATKATQRREIPKKKGGNRFIMIVSPTSMGGGIGHSVPVLTIVVGVSIIGIKQEVLTNGRKST